MPLSGFFANRSVEDACEEQNGEEERQNETDGGNTVFELLVGFCHGRLQICGFVSFLKPDHTHAGASSGES